MIAVSAHRAKKRLLHRAKPTKKRIIVSKKLKRLLVLAPLFLVAFIILSGTGLYAYMHSGIAGAFSTMSLTEQTINVQSLAVLSVKDIHAKPWQVSSTFVIFQDADAGRVVYFDVPNDLTIDMPGIFGEDRFEKLFYFAALADGDSAESYTTYAQKSITKVFGVKTDRLLVVQEDSLEVLDPLLRKGAMFGSLELFKVFGQLKQKMITDMSLKEFLKLMSFIDKLPSDRLETGNMAFIDDTLREITAEGTLADEKLSVSILNGAGESGFAGFGARSIRNLGARVISVSNSNAMYQEGVIITDNPVSETAQALARQFDISAVISKKEAEDYSEREIDRSDVVIILGVDTAGALY